jgi:hypothetical protein
LESLNLTDPGTTLDRIIGVTSNSVDAESVDLAKDFASPFRQRSYVPLPAAPLLPSTRNRRARIRVGVGLSLDAAHAILRAPSASFRPPSAANRGALKLTLERAKLIGMRMNFPAIMVVGLVAFVMNPGFACSSSEDKLPAWQYGEEEMTRAVEGTWRLTIERPEGESAVTFWLAPGDVPGSSSSSISAPGSSLQCSSRNFLRPAGACVDLSALYVSGQVLTAEAAIGTPVVTGMYVVTGVTYQGGSLELDLGPTLHVAAGLDATDQVTAAYTDENGVRFASRLERVQ